MKIRNSLLIQQYIEAHPSADGCLRAWFKVISFSAWSDFQDLEHSCYKVRKIGAITIFSLSDELHLIARINYSSQTVIVREIITGAEYAKRYP